MISSHSSMKTAPGRPVGRSREWWGGFDEDHCARECQIRHHLQRDLPRMGKDWAGRTQIITYMERNNLSYQDAMAALLSGKEPSERFTIPDQIVAAVLVLASEAGRISPQSSTVQTMSEGPDTCAGGLARLPQIGTLIPHEHDMPLVARHASTSKNSMSMERK
jgi:hypothetical protein